MTPHTPNLQQLTVAGLRVLRGHDRQPLSGLADDTRRLIPGGLYVVRPAATGDPLTHLPAAVAAGVAAVVVPQGLSETAAHKLPDHVALAEADGPIDQAAAGRIASAFHDHPDRRLKLVGITGTNGKTTVATIVQHLLLAAGVRTGLLGTVCVDDRGPGGPQTAQLTTPGSIELIEHLARMVAHGCEAAVMEVSSHALVQGRTDPLRFAAAVFTNLTGDHLDYHGTMDAYAEAKALLFDRLDDKAAAIINADDPYGSRMARDVAGHLIWTTLDDAVPADLCTADERVSLVPGRVVELTAEGSRVQLDGPWGAADVRLPLLGRHNVHNALQAAAAASAISDNYLAIRRALAEVPTAPGRLERVMPPDGQTARPAVLVDYAHTHDALHNVLTALRPITPGRLIVVFGCGGDRDRTKRPKMARVAHELADRVWVTSDNPRTEDPQRIIDDILAGVRSDDVPAERVLVDRQAAIHAAVRDAAVRDTVLIAGKGHETYQILPDPGSPDGTRTIHFDDREHAAAALADYPTAAVAA